MLAIKRSVAAFLSLLVILWPASAFACDLSCSLRTTHSQCHVASANSEGHGGPRSMDMGSSMDMGPMNMDSARKVDAGPKRAAEQRHAVDGVKPGHSMQSQVVILTEQFENAPVLESSNASRRIPAKRSSCDQNACGQIFSTARAPGAVRSLMGSSRAAVISISNTVVMHSEIDRRVPQVPPSQDGSLLSDFATILRI